MTDVLREKQNGSTARGIDLFWFCLVFVLVYFLITWKPNPLGRQNSHKCHCLYFWLLLKAKSSKETWAPLSHKENTDLASTGDDLDTTGLTCWFLPSIWLTVSYQSGAAPPSSRQDPAEQRANPGGQIPNWDEGDRQYLLSSSCLSYTMAKTQPTAFFIPHDIACPGWGALLSIICPNYGPRAKGFSFITKFVFLPVLYDTH